MLYVAFRGGVCVTTASHRVALCAMHSRSGACVCHHSYRRHGSYSGRLARRMRGCHVRATVGQCLSCCQVHPHVHYSCYAQRVRAGVPPPHPRNAPLGGPAHMDDTVHWTLCALHVGDGGLVSCAVERCKHQRTRCMGCVQLFHVVVLVVRHTAYEHSACHTAYSGSQSDCTIKDTSSACVDDVCRSGCRAFELQRTAAGWAWLAVTFTAVVHWGIRLHRRRDAFETAIRTMCFMVFGYGLDFIIYLSMSAQRRMDGNPRHPIYDLLGHTQLRAYGISYLVVTVLLLMFHKRYFGIFAHWLAFHKAMRRSALFGALFTPNPARNSKAYARSARTRLRIVRLEDIADPHLLGDGVAQRYAVSQPCSPGEIDIVVSRCNVDLPAKQLNVLQKIVKSYCKQHGREPKLWMADFCLDPSDPHAAHVVPFVIASTLSFGNAAAILWSEKYCRSLTCITEAFLLGYCGSDLPTPKLAEQISLYPLCKKQVRACAGKIRCG
eukprot:m.1508006 g.1508006  ORF g.1508006 m.1508006 type:complete len:494 (-) comp25209_c0_seq139:5735-7216(-)